MELSQFDPYLSNPMDNRSLRLICACIHSQNGLPIPQDVAKMIYAYSRNENNQSIPARCILHMNDMFFLRLDETDKERISAEELRKWYCHNGSKCFKKIFVQYRFRFIFENNSVVFRLK
jgi:hypothetical protein